MDTRKLSHLLRRLRVDTGGNAMMLMALGMPVLIGSSGLAVDVAQWYVWKRELQYAVDQAALAGAWASAEPKAAGQYKELAQLEYYDNLSVLREDASDPEVGKTDYNGGKKNSIVVSASTTRSLPFTQIIWGGQADISATAQASFQAATNYTTCLLALDPDDPSALIFGGSTTGTVTCGAGALSTSSTAIVKNGNPSVTINDIISGGGIDPGLASSGRIHQYISNLTDPFQGLEPPASPVARTYDCGSKNSSPTGTADVTTTTRTTYTYWQGKNRNAANTQVNYTGTGSRTGTTSSTLAQGQTVSGTVTNGSTVTVSDTENWTGKSWNSSTKGLSIYEKEGVVVTKSYNNVAMTAAATGNAHNLQPGTYSSIAVTCDTFFNPGVYYITGTFDLGQNKSVVGNDVMFVLTGSSSENFKLNSQSQVKFSGISKERLMTSYGVEEKMASRLAGMIIYDKKSTSDIRINGGAEVVFEGTIYAPLRNATFNGNSSMGGKCMMLAVATMTFTGTNDFSSFCLPPNLQPFDIGGTTIQVRLVS